MDTKKFIKEIIKFSPRQLEGEKKTAKFLMKFLNESGVNFSIQKFDLKIPKVKRNFLKVDDKLIEAEACCFEGGKISDKENLISSLVPSACFIDKSNINFNPKSNAIGLCNFCFAPSLAISKKDIRKILDASKIEGKVEIEKKSHQAVNILIGNTTNPEVISLAHYDSIKMGAIDNASGVAVMMGCILKNKSKKSFEKKLFVFSATEEISYDFPEYWGHGYRVFEANFYEQMKGAKKIVIIDSVGNGKTQLVKDSRLIKSAFPINNLEEWKKKISIIAGDFENLMSVYHSDLDDGRGIQEKFLREAGEFLRTEVGL